MGHGLDLLPLGRAFVPLIHNVVLFQSHEVHLQFNSSLQALQAWLTLDWPPMRHFNESTCHTNLDGPQMLTNQVSVPVSLNGVNC